MSKGESGANNSASSLFIGCAGWSLSSAVAQDFPREGSHLERYAYVLPAVEINTSFYRPHRPATYARWRESVPEIFRFAAKVPKQITHELKLRDADEALKKFIDEVSNLEHKLGCLLVQLPPRLQFEPEVAERFFRALQSLTNVDIVCEPRHATWFKPAAADMLNRLQVAYVDADPQIAPIPEAAQDAEVVYIRLHGSPVMYHSTYSEDYLDALAVRIADKLRVGRRVWCIFDNTASGAAVPNALSLLARLKPEAVLAEAS